MDNQEAQAVVSHLIPILTSYGLQVLGAIAILVAGLILAGFVGGVTRRALTRRRIDESLVGFAASLVKGGIIVFAVIAALSNFGVQTGSFIAVIGAAGLAVGLALQGSLSNFAAGVLIFLFRPFRVGDVVESSGSRGKVKEIGMLATTIATPDNQKVILPNGALMNSKIINVNAVPTRRVDLVASISYGDDLDQARDCPACDTRGTPKGAEGPRVRRGGLGDGRFIGKPGCQAVGQYRGLLGRALRSEPVDQARTRAKRIHDTLSTARHSRVRGFDRWRMSSCTAADN